MKTERMIILVGDQGERATCSVPNVAQAGLVLEDVTMSTGTLGAQVQDSKEMLRNGHTQGATALNEGDLKDANFSRLHLTTQSLVGLASILAIRIGSRNFIGSSI